MRKNLHINDKRRAQRLQKKQIVPLLKLVYSRRWKGRTHPDILKRVGIFK